MSAAWERITAAALTVNARFESSMMLLTPAALAVGFFCTATLDAYVPTVPYLFAFITFVMALGCGLIDLRQALHRPGLIAAALVLAHIVLPMIAFGTGALLFGAHSPYTHGLVLYTAIPLGVSSVIWIGMTGGQIPLALALIVLDSILSPFIVPATLKLAFGTELALNAQGVFVDLLLIVVLPTLLGATLRDRRRSAADSIRPVALPLSKLAFLAVLALNAAAIAPYALEWKADLPLLLPGIVLLIAIGYAVGAWTVGRTKTMQAAEEEAPRLTMAYAIGIRNISLGLVIGLAYLSPQASVPIVLAILLQQPAAALVKRITDTRRLNERAAERQARAQDDPADAQ
ncbi:bile acid:sodium symporter family protein [Xylanibacillus composti]|uniref:Na+-dependent transporter n=1 Tax=Xylanibacillus composti TaxID=1572762 RepID=A0A8J4M385_9BACL|nr:bile acid:sodium symporter [Xylanibacillus composti]MDT9724802.1 bile acid:sodium symporter family protein [Xylanibacillus composti]GIQ69845.1 hypothetical protein XYCOK13_26690 [Xylanibacillus composti]